MGRQHQPNRKRRVLDPAEVRQLFHEASPLGEGEMPEQAIGWLDLKNRWRRIEATYPNGWIVSLVWNDAGEAATVSARKKFSFRVTA